MSRLAPRARPRPWLTGPAARRGTTRLLARGRAVAPGPAQASIPRGEHASTSDPAARPWGWETSSSTASTVPPARGRSSGTSCPAGTAPPRTARASSTSASSPRSAPTRLGPPGRHAGAGHRQPADARHRQQLRRLLGAAPQRHRPARDRRDRELRPAEADGRPARLAHLLRRARPTPPSTRATPPGRAAGALARWPRPSPPARSRGRPTGSTPPTSPSAATRSCSPRSDGVGNQAYASPHPRPAAGARQRRPLPPAAVQQGRRARARRRRRHRQSMLVDWVDRRT